MKEHIIPAIRLTLASLVFFCGFYTVLIWGAAQFTANKGGGERINEKGHFFYSNIGQNFTEDKYFWSRPSAVGYNAAGAGGSNKGPSNPDYLEQVSNRIDSFLAHNPGISKSSIPSDLVTASGSGLDPHISVQSARVQIQRISRLRGITQQDIERLVITHTEKPLLGMLGTERINVLKLNIALNNLK